MDYYNLSVQWHITENCRNRCKHCYIESSDKRFREAQELDFVDLDKILQNFERFEKRCGVNISHFAITGGDPFEHRDFEKLLSALHAKGKNIKILGIPERITDENLELLSRYNVTEYQVSLDGLEKTHDALRGKGSFGRTISAIKYIAEHSKIAVSVMFTIHNGNCEELFPLIEFLEKENVRLIFRFDVLVLEGNAKQGFELLNKYKINEIMQQYRRKRLALKSARKPLILYEKMKLFNTLGKNNVDQSLKKYSDGGGCGCGFTNITILPNGDVFPCRRLPILLGNLLSDELTNIFLNNITLRKLRRISSFEYCGDCDYAKVCRGCPALAYSTTGNAFAQFLYCNNKQRVVPSSVEPDLDCTEEEELAYIKNTYISNFLKSGYGDNKEGALFHIYDRIFFKGNFGN